MAGAHPYYSSYFADIMRVFFESSFERWALNWMTVKVMLHHTDALICGPSANALMQPYTSRATMRHPHYMISKTIVLNHKDSVKYPVEIQIHVSSRENPRASVIRQQLTGLSPYVCAQGFCIHYPDLTLNANHKYIPIECAANIGGLKKLDRLARNCGLQLRKYHFGSGRRSFDLEGQCIPGPILRASVGKGTTSAE
ncbi:hypothetical protein FB451DRAFT_1173347 [Mycena latifolia]|nr:hypothetical protein FB451DRAFT_1173347 [Mycena latifolia]